MKEETAMAPIWLRSQPLVAAAIGLAAAALAWLCWNIAPATRTALDWALYDRWVFHSPIPAADSAVVLITRDTATDARFGSGLWERALIGRLLAAVHDGGASVIGVDLDLTQPSPPQLGGPGSDAQLAEATSQAGNVVYPLTVDTTAADLVSPNSLAEHGDELRHPSWPSLTVPPPLSLPPLALALHGLPPLAHQAQGLGHLGAVTDADRTIRRVPLWLATTHHAVPSFGLLLAAGYYHVSASRMVLSPGGLSLPNAQLPGGTTVTLTIPTDPQGALVAHDPGDGRAPRFTVLSFEEVWASIEQDDPGRLRKAIEGKVAVLFPHPASGSESGHAGVRPEAMKRQLHLLNTIVTRQWTRSMPSGWNLILAVVVASLAAGLSLRGSSWTGPVFAVVLLVGVSSIAGLALFLAQWVVPLTLPVTAGVIAMVAALGWDRLASAQRVRWLERDRLRAEQALLAVREALAVREGTVDALEEDLEAARQAVAQSAGQQADLTETIAILRRQVAEAHAQEDAARARLADAERAIHALQPAEPAAGPLSDSALERLRQQCEALGIHTQDPVVLRHFQTLMKAARSSLPILLLGEPGTGKELFARAAHRLSPRAGKPFIAINMAAVSPELFESELFGHMRGSFTGAHADRKGLFELAHQGTLFLDEIGDLRLDHQSKLLRVLQDKSFYRVGASTLTRVDVRIVAATNKDLRQGVTEGWFREDLFFRLQGLVIQLPPLRARRGDIPLLAQLLLHTFATQLGRPDLSLSHEALKALTEADWKGNVRELSHCLEQATALSDGPRISKADLRLGNEMSAGVDRREATAILPDAAGDAAVLASLQEHQFDMQATARALNWDRGTVTHRLKGMGFQALVEAEGNLPRAAEALAGHPALVRLMELKLKDYYDHLVTTIQTYTSPQDAIAHCRRRFKSLPDRHFHAVERLIERYFALRQIDLPITQPHSTSQR